MRCLASIRVWLVLTVVLAACGSGTSSAPSQRSPSSSDSADAGAGDGGTNNEPPFAESAADATTMITAAVDSKSKDLAVCVREFRARKNLQHERVEVSIGIDQEGKLLGVTSKGKEDTQLKACFQQALSGARFPRSRAGIITIKKNYEERLQ